MAHRQPDGQQGWKELIVSLSNVGVSRDSIRVVTRLLGTFPDDVEALMAASQYLHMIARPIEACALIDCAVEIAPTSLAARRQRARILELIDAEQALRAWQAIRKELHGDPEAAFQAGKLALALGKTELGEAALREAIATPSAKPAVVMRLFGHLLWSGRHHEARQLCKQAIRRWPRAPEAWVPAFELLRVTSSKNAAERLAQRLDRATMDHVRDRLVFADVLGAIGRVDSARAVLRDLLSHPTEGFEAAARLIKNLLRSGDLDGAEQIARSGSRWTAASLGNKSSADLASARAFAAKFVPPGTDAGGTLQDIFLQEFERTRRNPTSKIAPRAGVVLHIVHSLALGGTERQCAMIAAAQARRGSPKEVWVLRTDPGEHGRAVFFLDQLTAAGVKSTTLTRFRLSAPHDQRMPPLLSACDGVLADLFGSGEISGLLAAIHEIRPSVVHAWTPQICAYGAIAAQLAGVPKTVLRVGSIAPGDRQFRTEIETQHFAWLRAALRSVMSATEISLLSNCQANLDGWLNWLGLDRNEMADKVGLQPNILDPAGNARSVSGAEVRGIRKRLRLAKGVRVIGCVTRFEREKGIDLWYQVAERICAARDDVVFVLAGEGRLKSEIEQWASRPGIAPRVRLVDPLSDELPALISSFDVAILTSYFEGVPNSLLEAQWYGVPVVASDVGGVCEAMLAGRSGLLVERSCEGFAEAIETLLDDRRLRRKMQAAARQFAAENFSPEASLRVLDRAYEAPQAARSRRFIIQPARVSRTSSAARAMPGGPA